MKLKIDPKYTKSGVVSSLIKDRLVDAKANSKVHAGVNLADIASKLVEKRFNSEKMDK